MRSHNWILSARNYVENRPAYQEEDYYDEADDYEPDAPARPVGRRGAAGHRENARPVSRSQKRSAIDIPLDSVDTASSAAQRGVDEPLFDSRPGVRPPMSCWPKRSGKVQEKTVPAVDLPEEDPLAGLDLQFPDMDFTFCKARSAIRCSGSRGSCCPDTDQCGREGRYRAFWHGECFFQAWNTRRLRRRWMRSPEVPAEVIPRYLRT